MRFVRGVEGRQPFCFALALWLLTGMLAASALWGQERASQERTSTDWPGFNGGLAADRYAPYTQITPQNVSRLTQVFVCQTDDVTAFQCGPVKIGDTLYVTTSFDVYAFDARTGTKKWEYQYDSAAPPSPLPTGLPNRGVAFGDGKVFRGTNDAHLIALDIRTGKLAWNVAAGDYKIGEYLCTAPIVWQNRVYVGNAGSDLGLIGRMMAFDIKTGRRLWSFDMVPNSGPALATWSPDPKHPRAGGGMYSSCALDVKTGTLYVPTGNPGPDFDADYRPGDNLYTCSVVMLDARNGRLKGYHQFTPHDYHDWDVAASPTLFTAKSGKPMVAVASKNGYLYGLNRDLTTVLYQTPIARIENETAPITPEGTHFFPGTSGGANWNGAAFSPALNALFVPTTDAGNTVKLGGDASLQFMPGKPFLGSSNGFGTPDPVQTGRITAVEADTGKPLWMIPTPRPMVAALLPTASGLLFGGDLNGDLFALEASTGKELFRTSTGNPVGGGIISYLLDGRQYIAVASGLNSPLWQTKSGPAKLVVYALPVK